MAAGGKNQEATIKKFATKVRVYWADCDPAGILYYGNFFRFFEFAEEELFSSLGYPRPEFMQENHMGFPRVETWARFRKPARQGDLIEVTGWIAERSEKSLLYRFEIRRDGDPELAAEGSYRVVSVSRPQFLPIPMPEKALELLRDYLPPLSPSAKERTEATAP